jgi:hypothetical protein
MQRLYSMFPAGGPGIGLLLLRASVAAGCFLDGPVQAADHFARSDLLLRAVLDAALGLGVLTPLTVLLSCVLAIVEIAGLGVMQAPVAWVTLVNAVALGLLGPGAYSLDARLFGRRVLVVLAKDRDACRVDAYPKE